MPQLKITIASLENYCSRVIARSDMKIKNWYVEGRSTDDICIGDWQEFKNKFIRFCLGDTIDSVRKYKDEKLSNFVKRISE